jgi:flagellar hook-basal body complex protein FliE
VKAVRIFESQKLLQMAKRTAQESEIVSLARIEERLIAFQNTVTTKLEDISKDQKSSEEDHEKAVQRIDSLEKTRDKLAGAYFALVVVAAAVGAGCSLLVEYLR